MSDLQNLYQRIIIDHYRNPRNFHELDHANWHADGHNPLCGDKLTVYLEIENRVVKDIGFTGTGCAIFMASASMMTENVKLKTLEEVRTISERFFQWVDTSRELPPAPAVADELSAFSGVRGYPSRVKCASLPWTTLQKAVASSQKSECRSE
jgi:nitrogen fixation NifU-like protein